MYENRICNNKEVEKEKKSFLFIKYTNLSIVFSFFKSFLNVFQRRAPRSPPPPPPPPPWGMINNAKILE